MIASASGLQSGSALEAAFADESDIPSWSRSSVHSKDLEMIIQSRVVQRYAPNAYFTRAEAETYNLEKRTL